MLYLIPDLGGIKHPVRYRFIVTSGNTMVLECTKLFSRKTHNNTIGVVKISTGEDS